MLSHPRCALPWGRAGRAITGALLLVSAATPCLQAQLVQPANDTAGVQATHVVVSAAGGIAKGSYQGGLDWTINEVLRRQRFAAWRIAHLRADSSPASVVNPLVLSSASGASAGNINALLGAVSWCTSAVRHDDGTVSTNIGAEESPYWNAWVNTGFEDLLPERDKVRDSAREAAVLDRRFFEVAHRAMLRDFMARATPVANCRVPVGITLTRILPLTVTRPELNVSADVQRFAAVFNVGTLNEPATQAAPAREPRITFFAPDDGTANATSLGALALLPELESTAQSSDQRRLDAVFNVVLASSSFPVAFAPRTVCYARGGLAAPASGEARSETTCDLFNDGGIFDNNPLALGLRLHELRPRTGRSVPPASIAFTNPGNLRGSIVGVRGASLTPQQRLGLGMLVQLFGGIWRSATEYELHSLLRTNARDHETRADSVADVARLDVNLSTRSMPIFGEYLNSFAGFLGRPLREYDFYSGVYDGLRYVAEHIVCSNAPADSVRTCAERQHSRLVETNALELSTPARAVLQWHHDREYRGVVAPSKAVGPQPDSATAILRAIDIAAEPLRTRPLERYCPRIRANLLGQALCTASLDDVLQTLKRDQDFVKRISAARDTCERDAALRARGACVASEEFVRFIENPTAHLNTLVDRALRNLQDAEDALKDRYDGMPQYSAWTELAHMTYRAHDYRYRRGLEINPSSALWDGTKASRFAGSFFLGGLAPNYIVFWGRGRSAAVRTPSDSGFRRTQGVSSAFGWHPLVYHTGKGISVASVLEVSSFDDYTASRRKRYDLAPGIGVMSHGPLLPLALSSIELSLLTSRHTLKSIADGFGYEPVVQLTGRALFDKVQIGVRTSRRRGTAVQLGISDVNGILYWILR